MNSTSIRKLPAIPERGNEHHRHEQTAKNDAPPLVAVRKIAGHRLDDKGQKAVDAGDESHLGQAQVQLGHECRKKRAW